MKGTSVAIDLEAVILAVSDDVPRIITLDRGGRPALPSGPLDPGRDRTLELGLRRWVLEQTGLEVGYVEQLYTFGDQFRDPSEQTGGARLLSIAYLALVREEQPSVGAVWQAVYNFLPWEDRRSGPHEGLSEQIAPAVEQWLAGDGASREERARIALARDGTPWDPVRVLDRYELLYELGLVPEKYRDRNEREPQDDLVAAQSMAADHRRVLATALGRVRGKLTYRPVVFELLPERFTLGQLQAVVEALSGVRFHKQNFRRLVDRAGLVEGIGELDAHTGGRPAELYRFRREVVVERPRPGVGLPGLRS